MPASGAGGVETSCVIGASSPSACRVLRRRSRAGPPAWRESSGCLAIARADGGGFRREVQPRRQHWFLNRKSGFPFRTPAFCLVSKGQRLLGEKEHRARSVTPGVALRVGTQGPSERLMRRFGMPVSDTTILAGLRKHARARSESSAVAAVHVAGVDDWAWRKGSNYGTIIVDLEHRVVVDVLADRSAAPRPVGSGIIRKWRWSAATVLGSMRRRLRAGGRAVLQARQVADRFHLLQNFREIVERQLGGYEAAIRDTRINTSDNHAASPLPERSDRPSDAVAQTRLIRRERQAVRQQDFDEIRALFEGGSSIGEIARKLGLGRRRVERWVRRIDLPGPQHNKASTSSTPASKCRTLVMPSAHRRSSRNAEIRAFCEDDTPRPGGGAQRYVGALSNGRRSKGRSSRLEDLKRAANPVVAAPVLSCSALG